METDGGGWTVFQRRMDGTQSFFQVGSSSYISGFGDFNGEFWLNLNNIHRLTMLSGINTTLRVDLDDFEGNTRFAKYSTFQVLNSATDYQLEVTGYSGDAGDSLATSNSQAFIFASFSLSSIGRLGAWWHEANLTETQLEFLVNRNESHFANLNGIYYRAGQYDNRARPDGIFWSSWRGLFYSLKFTEMKLRRERPLGNSANPLLSSAITFFISVSASFWFNNFS